MTLTFIGLIVAAAAVLTFLASRGRKGWVLFVCAILFVAAGTAGIRLLEKGAQENFTRLPLTVTQQAWALNLIGFVGIGGLAGTAVRGCLAVASRFRKAAPAAQPAQPTEI